MIEYFYLEYKDFTKILPRLSGGYESSRSSQIVEIIKGP